MNASPDEQLIARDHERADAPALHRELTPAFDAVLADLGITGSADLFARAERTIRFLPHVWSRAEALMSAAG